MNGKDRKETDVLLAESLKELAQEHPIEKITIKEITDKAGVIRPTFYNHFQDKYELLEWILRMDLLEPVRPLIQNGMITEAMVLVFTGIEKEKHFYVRAVKMEGAVSFFMIACKCIREVLLEILKERIAGNTKDHPWLTPEIIAGYYAQSMCFAFEEWIKSGMNVSPKEMAEIYYHILTHSLEEILNEM